MLLMKKRYNVLTTPCQSTIVQQHSVLAEVTKEFIKIIFPCYLNSDIPVEINSVSGRPGLTDQGRNNCATPRTPFYGQAPKDHMTCVIQSRVA